MTHYRDINPHPQLVLCPNNPLTLFTPDRRQSKTLITIDERRSKIARTSVFDRCMSQSCHKWQSKTLFLTIFYLCSSIVLTFLIDAYPMCLSCSYFCLLSYSSPLSRGLAYMHTYHALHVWVHTLWKKALASNPKSIC